MNNYLRSSVATIALVSVFQIATIAPAFAAVEESTNSAESDDAQSGGFDDIIVTAQKREQRLNDVGISISVASSEALQAAGVADASQLGAIVPGFSAPTTVFGATIFSLRGVNFNSFQASAPPTVSTYIDEAVLPYPVMGQALFLDVERVEVLKGPQGTLFGQNATGGSVNVIAAKPTSTLSAGLRTDINHWGQVSMEGFVSGPISDTLNARVAASTTQFGGWQRGYYLNDQKNGDQNKSAARLLLDWTPTDRVTVAVNINGSYNKSELLQSQVFIVAPAVPAGVAPGFLDYNDHLPTRARDADFDLGLDTRANDRNIQAVLRVDYEVTDNLTLTSISNYIDNKTRQPHDQDGTAIHTQVGDFFADIESINQELRLTGDIPSAGVNFVFGASYGKDKINEGLHQDYFAYSGFPPNSPATWDYDLTQRAMAVFGNVDFEITPQLTFTAGARYTATRQSIVGCTYDDGPGGLAGTAGFLAGLSKPGVESAYVPGGCITIDDTGADPTFLPIITNQSQKEDNISWRAGLNYKVTDDSLLYGIISRGYKAGTYPVIIQLFESGNAPVTQEELTSYEIGAKMSLLDRRFQLNVSGFYYDYKDKQFFGYSPTGGVVTTATLLNIPKSTVKGFDVDITARPVDGFTLRGGLTHVKTEIDSFSGFDFQGAPLDFAGTEFSYASPWSGNLDAEYRAALSDDLEGYLGGNMTFNSRTYGDLGQVALDLIPAYTIFDARIGVDSDKGWRAGLWVRNLTDKFYWTSILSGGDTKNRYVGTPRTFGATFSVRY